MKQKSIITISRQFASGGKKIGEKLAKDLNIPFYDKEIITIASKESGYSKQLFEKLDEKPSNSLLYSLAMGSFMIGGTLVENIDLPLNDKVFLAQSNVIRDIAKKSSCVVVGRCADYILKEDPDVINIFIHSDIKSRSDRAINDYSLPPDKIKDMIKKNDKRRSSYYNYYTGLKWGKAENYHLCLNSDFIGLENCIEIIKKFIDSKK